MTNAPIANISRIVCGLVIATLVAACGPKDAAKPAPDASKPSAPGVASTGKVITIEMITDEQGNRFAPKNLEAHPGDVLRFTVAVGVHNVHFISDSNPGVPNLPEMSDMLQLPGQTFDVPVNFAPGKTYYFQCDPHAPLGMHGYVKVEDH